MLTMMHCYIFFNMLVQTDVGITVDTSICGATELNCRCPF